MRIKANLCPGGSVRPGLFKEYLAAASAAPGSRERARQRLARLTPRERDVFEGIVQGLTNREIGSQLDISQRTVELHRARLMHKLEVHKVSEPVKLSPAAAGRMAPEESV